MLILKGHTNSVQALVYTPDGRTLISAGDDRTIRLWDVQTGDEIGRLTDHPDAILTLSIHPNGTQLASGGHDKQVRLWDLEKLRLLEAYQRFSSTINAVAFSADGAMLAAGADRGSNPSLLLHDLTRKKTNALFDPIFPSAPVVWSLAFSPSEAPTLAVGWASGGVDLWDDSKGSARAYAHDLPHSAGITALAFSPDGQYLAALVGTGVIVWDIKTGRIQTALHDHTGRTWSIAYSPDGRTIATGGWDSTVRLWDAETGQVRARYDWQLGRILAVAFAPDGLTAAAAGYEKDIIIWDVD